MPSLKAKLKQAKKNWTDQKERLQEDSQFADNAPDGLYIARVSKCRIDQMGANDTLMMLTEFTVLEGENAGETAVDFNNLEREDGLLWTARALRRLGVDDVEEYDPEDWPELAEQIEAAQPVFRIQVKTTYKDGREYQNPRIKKGPLDYDGDDQAEPVVEEVEEEEEEEEVAEEKKTYDIGVGSTVSCDFDGDDFEGEVLSIDEDSATAKVEFEDGTFEVSLEDCTLAEEERGKSSKTTSPSSEKEEEEAELKKGDTVVWEKSDGSETEGKVSSVDAEAGTCKVKVGKKTVTKNTDDVEIIADVE